MTVLVAGSLTTGCDTSTVLAWRAGKTHGVIIEATAGRASLGIYRKPRSVLYDVYDSGGIRQVQDVIWALGQPPAFRKTFTYRGRSITTSFGTQAVRDATHSLIYDHPSDLRQALLDAETHHNCLALTLISYGTPTHNWTSKDAGCQMGALP